MSAQQRRKDMRAKPSKQTGIGPARSTRTVHVMPGARASTMATSTESRRLN